MPASPLVTRFVRPASAALFGAILTASILPNGWSSAHAEEPQRTTLGENAVARFVASLPEMRRLAARLSPELPVGEINPDDPLMPFIALAEAAVPPHPQTASVLAAHGFATLDAWLAVGRPVMDAYWAREQAGTRLGLAVQLAPILFAIQGRTEPSAQDIAQEIDRLEAAMHATSPSDPPAADMRLEADYHAAITKALESKW